MGNFDLGTRLLPEIEFHRRREKERGIVSNCIPSFLPFSSSSKLYPTFVVRVAAFN